MEPPCCALFLWDPLSPFESSSFHAHLLVISLVPNFHNYILLKQLCPSKSQHDMRVHFNDFATVDFSM